VSEQRFIVAQYCDDIRQEVGNKFSLIGCYAADLIVPSFPAVLPKLCAHIKVYTSADRPFERLTVRLMRDEEIIAEIAVDPRAYPDQPQDKSLKWQIASAFLVMTPFAVESECALRLEADTETGVFRTGAFRIHLLSKPNDGTSV
jgi:hypothetical protein